MRGMTSIPLARVGMEIIYSDKDIIVINKPPGISVHGGDSVLGKTVVDFLLERFPEIAGVGEDPVRPGIVHRLDRDTSGVMVVARTQESFLALKKLFATRAVTKTYRAIVCGTPALRAGVIDFPIGRMASNPTKRGVVRGRNEIRGAREAVTEYRVIKASGEYSFVELKPKTGRMHQLRVHMAAIGHPVACDAKYGGKKVCCPADVGRPAGAGLPVGGAKPRRQLLHAQSLSFSLRPGRMESFEADPPEDFMLAQYINFDRPDEIGTKK